MTQHELTAAYNYMNLAKLILKHCGNVLHEDLDATMSDLQAQISEMDAQVVS